MVWVLQDSEDLLVLPDLTGRTGKSDQSFRDELRALLALRKRSRTRPLADFTVMSKRRRMTIHIERLASTNDFEESRRRLQSRDACGPHGRPSSGPVCVAVEARLRAARAALQRARPRCEARHAFGPHGRPSCVPRVLRPGTSSGRTGGPPTCPTVAAAAARRLPRLRAAVAASAAAARRLPRLRAAVAASAAAARLLRPPYSMSSVIIVMYSPLAYARRTVSALGS